jgi:hypothetical protein
MPDDTAKATARKRLAPNIAAALDLARRGFHVFPIADGKKAPALCRWSREATTDEAAINKWWSNNPCANVGIATGPSGLIVVDIDNKGGKDGDDSLFDLELMWGELPATLSATTASGGRHIYLRGSTRNSVCKLGDGLDVRSVGGYVVAPGSRLDDGGGYAWDRDLAVADAPDWLVELASEPKRADYAADAGAGNVSASHLALILAELDAGDYREHDRWLELMMACHHATAGLGADEFIEWSTADPPYAGDGDLIRYRWDSLSVDPDGRRPITERTLFDAVVKKVGYVPHCDPSEDFEPVEVDAEIDIEVGNLRSRFRVFRPSELLARPKPRWLVEGMLVEGELAVVYGPPKAGKTFLVLDMALSVATGTEFHGGREVGAPGPVLYVIGEGNDELFGERIRAWCDARGLPLPDDSFLAVADRPDITKPEDVAELIKAGPRPRLIILDTLSRTMVGDENSPSDMAAYVRGCDRLRAQTGAAVVVVHHEGKDASRGPMGHTKLRGALDTSIRVHAKNGTVWVEMADQRNGPGDLALNFRIDGQVLTLVGQGGHDETAPEDFLDGDDLKSRIRRIVAAMAGSGKSEVIKALMAEFTWKQMTARRQLDDAVPTGSSPDCAVQFEGGRLWFERTNPAHPSSPATARFERPVSDP